MSESAADSPPRARGRLLRRVLLALLVLAAIVAALLYWVSRPDRATALLLGRVGTTLGLEITASGANQYRLRGTPMLELRDVIAREPGAATPLLRARRIQLRLPWSTLRARGSDLIVRRIELDAPQADLAALQHWLAGRPPSKARLPTFTNGLAIVDGVLRGSGWQIRGFHAELPSLHPDRPLRAHLRGRFIDAPLTVTFDLALAAARPQALMDGTHSGFAARGPVAIEHQDWRLPTTLAISGPLRVAGDQLAIRPMRLGAQARYEAGETRLRFVLGLHGPLQFRQSTWSLQPAGVALRGAVTADSPIPDLDARGALALGRRLAIRLQGRIADWPRAWPTLPPPIGQSRSPLPFALDYLGAPDLADVARLRLRRDATGLDARFRLPDVLAWIDTMATASPLPPLDGVLSTPRLEISGATLEGVEIEFDEETVHSP